MMLRSLIDLRGRPRRKAALAAATAALVLAPVSFMLSGADEPAAAAPAPAAASYTRTVSALASEKLTERVLESFASEAASKVRAEVESIRAAEQAAAEEAKRIQAEDEASEARAQEEAARAQAAPAPVPDPAQPVVDRVIHVGLAGGQDVVDMGAGPVLFPLPAGWPPYVAEHDYHGGWQRFGTLSHGMTVAMTGLVSGTYTVGEIINVPRGGTVSDLRFSSMPKVLLQTCIPGTNLMVVVGLY